MSQLRKKLFNYDRSSEFPEKLAQWIGDVFYDMLPEHGYEVRDEQIYTAYQIAEAMGKKKVHLAEAGLGVGKTFAYLLSALAYARFAGKPVIIACASTALQEQLSGQNGDIQTLARLLDIEVDVKMAKDPRQYVCDARVQELELSDSVKGEILEWVQRTKSGERSEIPHVPDKVWRQINWDESMSCDKCENRGYCKLVEARKQYRAAKDLIIADHDIFFEDLWTRDSLKADGKSPILPNYSGVIFDEGHKVMLPALMHAGQQIIQEDMDDMIYTLEQIQGARESMVSIAAELEQASGDFFAELDGHVIEDDFLERLSLRVDDVLLKAAADFRTALDHLLLELQIEQELHIESLPPHLLHVFEAHIESATLALSRFGKNQSRDVITWLDKQDGSFWVVPRHIHKILSKHLFKKNLPVVFTSATLSNDGDFGYFSRILGLSYPSTSTVENIYDMKKQVTLYRHADIHTDGEEAAFNLKITELVSLLNTNNGRALILTKSTHEMERIREALKAYEFPFKFLWEDKGERGYLVRQFKEDISSVLIGVDFWEGIDVPGEALSLLVIWQLPFPSMDPLIEARRKEAVEEGLDPMTSVDYPEMGLKLKQGCGRLIRARADLGTIAILEPYLGTPWELIVLGALGHAVD